MKAGNDASQGNSALRQRMKEKMNCDGRGGEKHICELTKEEILEIKWKKAMWKEILFP